MKKRVQTLLSLVLILITMLFSFSNASADSNNRKVNEKVAVEEYRNVLEKMKTDTSYIEAFAGVYIDDNGDLNINIVGDEKKIKNKINSDKIKYHSAKWTKKELLDEQEKLNEKFDELEIKATEVDEINNTLIIYLDDLSNEKIKKIKKETIISNAEFKKFEVDISFSATEIINGKNVGLSFSGGTSNLSIGAAVKKHQLEKWGF